MLFIYFYKERFIRVFKEIISNPMDRLTELKFQLTYLEFDPPLNNYDLLIEKY